VQSTALPGVPDQAFNRGGELDGAVDGLGSSCADFVIWKIERHLQTSGEIEQSFPTPSDLVGQSATQLTGRQADGSLGASPDQLSDGLDLKQIQTPVKIRTAGELSGLSQARASCHEKIRDSFEQNGIAMAGQLDDVVTGVGGWTRHHDDQGDVQLLSGGPVDDGRPIEDSRLTHLQAPTARYDELGDDRNGTRTADPDHADCSGPRRRGEAQDGVGGGKGSARSHAFFGS
jgi:hypothetical protein